MVRPAKSNDMPTNLTTLFPGDGALIAAVFSSVFLVYIVSFGIWQSWLIFTCIIVFILTTLAGQREALNE